MKSDKLERLSLKSSGLLISCFEYVFESGGGYFDHLYVGTTTGEIMYFPCQTSDANTSSYTIQAPLPLLTKSVDSHGNLDTSLTNHEAEVTCLTYVKSSKLLYSGSLDRTIKVWNVFHSVDTNALLQTIIGHTGAISAVLNVGRDDPLSIFSLATDGTLKMWQPQKGRNIMRDPFYQCTCTLSASTAKSIMWFSSAAVSIRGPWQIYAGMSDGSIFLLRKAHDDYDDEAPRTLKIYERWDRIHDLRISSLQLTDGGTLLMSLSLDLSCRVMDPANGQTIFSLNNQRKYLYTSIVAARSISKATTFYYVLDEAGYMDVFSLFQEKKMHTLQVVPEVNEYKTKHLRLSHNGKAIAHMNSFGLLPNSFVSIVPQLGGSAVRQIKTSGCSPLAGDILLWNIEDDATRVEFIGHVGPVLAVAVPNFSNPVPRERGGASKDSALSLSREEAVIFSAGQDDLTLRCWDEYDLSESYQLKDKQAFGADTVTITAMLCVWRICKIAVGYSDGKVNLYSSDSGSFVTSNALKGSLTALSEAHNLSSDLLLGADDTGHIAIWNLTIHCSNPGKFQTEALFRGFHERSSPGIGAMYFHKESKTLFSGGDDCLIQYWKINDSHATDLDLGHSDPICVIKCTPTFLLTADEGGAAILCQIQSSNGAGGSSAHAGGGSAHAGGALSRNSIQRIFSFTCSYPSRSICDVLEVSSRRLYFVQTPCSEMGQSLLWAISCEPLELDPSTSSEAEAKRDSSLLYRKGDENTKESTVTCVSYHESNPSLSLSCSLVKALNHSDFEVSCCTLAEDLSCLYLGTAQGIVLKFIFEN